MVGPLALACVAVKIAALAALAFAVWPSSASAYRPFESTDPAVADPGDIEVELSPASFRHDESGQTWIAPELRLNYGFAENWEVVLEGQGEYPRGVRGALVANAVSLKTILREGSLQEKSGVSLATEAAVLLPGVNADSGIGASLTGIAGERWSWGAVHVNIAAGLSRERRGEIFVGTIVEGPGDWQVRPVAEIVYDREFGLKEEFAVLAGFIWQAREGLSLDFAVRQAAQPNARPETEIRAGVSFAFSAR